MKSQILALGMILAVTGCAASRQTILTVPAVSMTTPSTEVGYSAQPGEKVSAEYCQGDDPVTSNDKNVGLIDEAVMKAQKKSGAAYISDATISQKGSCVMVEGTAMLVR
jgi:hypothetical protein